MAARDSTQIVRAADPKAFKQPLLIIAAKEDPAVDPDAQNEFCDRIEKCTLFRAPNAGHELLIETSEIRTAFLACMEAFVVDSPTWRDECIKGGLTNVR